MTTVEPSDMENKEPELFAEVGKLISKKRKEVNLSWTISDDSYLRDYVAAKELLVESLKREKKDDDQSTVLLTFQNNMCGGGYGPGFRQDMQYCIPWKKVKDTVVGKRFVPDKKFLYVSYDMSLPSKASEEDKELSACIDSFIGGNEEEEETTKKTTDNKKAMEDKRYDEAMTYCDSIVHEFMGEPVDKTDADKTAVDKTDADKTAVDKTAVDKTDADKTDTDKTDADKDKTVVDEATIHLLYDAEMDDGAGESNLEELNSLKLFVPPTRFITCRAFS